jgi:hypothetical protein
MRRRRGRTSTGQHQLAHVRSVVAESRETPPSCRVGTGHRARTWSTALRHRLSPQSCVFTRGVRPRVAPTNPTVRPRRAYWGPANESAEAGGRRAPAITAHFEEYDHSDEAKRDACFHESAATSSAETSGTVASALDRRPAQAAVPASPLVWRHCGSAARADRGLSAWLLERQTSRPGRSGAGRSLHAIPAARRGLPAAAPSQRKRPRLSAVMTPYFAA